MALDEEILAIRTSVALATGDRIVGVRISGADAFQAVDRACPLELTLQDGQMKASLLLDEEGVPFADIYVCRDDESYLLLAEGPTPGALEAYLKSTFPAGAEVSLERLDRTHRVLSLHGPYAWELLMGYLGPDVPGLPYMAVLRGEGSYCFRGGKTGEYGCDTVVPETEATRTEETLLNLGHGFSLACVGHEALDHCALENWFYKHSPGGPGWPHSPRAGSRMATFSKERLSRGRSLASAAYSGVAATSHRGAGGRSADGGRRNCLRSNNHRTCAECGVLASDPCHHRRRRARRALCGGRRVGVRRGTRRRAGSGPDHLAARCQ